eukprot:CAMPEP_0184456130 /NCGR_PEP_ID=MMETSP0740-20130409/25788_1 /TAXON_ID=385413 /ORGANISM="Thalassiosira miniscula, Strain CCMP1093" /LENGTH=98 /DNA_ID=CAMNT_0026828163 /DNA_START=179 /DNA_END=475 /DNA_ORIENTATION=+
MWQSRCAGMQGLKAEVYTRGNHAAHIGPILGDHVKVGSGAKVNHNNVSAMSLISSHCICQTVGTGLCAFIHARLMRQFAFGFTHHQRTAVKKTVCENP